MKKVVKNRPELTTICRYEYHNNFSIKRKTLRVFKHDTFLVVIELETQNEFPMRLFDEAMSYDI